MITKLDDMLAKVTEENATLRADAECMAGLIDGCYEVVELWPALTPAQKIWKRKWLDTARKYRKG